MDPAKARELAQLSARVQQATVLGQGQESDADRAAIGAAALGITGIETQEFAAAMAEYQKGNKVPMQKLAEKAAQHVGLVHPEQSAEILGAYGLR